MANSSTPAMSGQGEDMSLGLRLMLGAWSLWCGVWVVVVTLVLSSVVILGSWAGGGKWLGWVAVVWAKMLMWPIGCPVRRVGELPEEEGFVIAANHSSFLDIPALLAGLERRVYFVAKQELFSIPIFGQAMAAACAVALKRDSAREAMATLAQVGQMVAEGECVVIFPEGTRSRTGEMLPFKAGAFSVATGPGSMVVPVCIHGTRRALPPGSWLLRPGRIEVRVGRAVRAEGKGSKARAELARAVRAEIEKLCRERY